MNKSDKKNKGSVKGGAAKPKENKSKERIKFVFPEYPKPLTSFFRSHTNSRSSLIEELCELLNKEANRQLREDCSARHFTIDSIFRPCIPTSNTGSAKPVDLVVIIDTSGSMSDEANKLSTDANEAIDNAKKRCAPDLRVSWYGLEGTFPNTKFNTTLRDYLHSLNVQDSDIEHRTGYLGQEDGGAAIKDVCDHFDWRQGASRAILFLGDEPLAGGEPQNIDDQTAADNAIAAARKSSVTVFTYAGTGIESFYDSSTGIRAEDEFARVATSTGGLAYSAAAGNIGEFQQILEEIICAASGGMCAPVALPEIRPCFSLQWGDSETDKIETDDVEVLCLTAWNPYTNVTFTDLTLYLVIAGPDGTVAKLPDGTPSVVIKPDSIIGFGEITPCAGDKNIEPSSVSREVVLISRGAKEGTYYIFAVYCYSVELKLAYASVFPIELVKS